MSNPAVFEMEPTCKCVVGTCKLALNTLGPKNFMSEFAKKSQVSPPPPENFGLGKKFVRNEMVMAWGRNFIDGNQISRRTND